MITIIGINGFKLFHINFIGILVINQTIQAKIVPIARPIKLSVENSIAIYMAVMTILNLGSNLCITLSLGKYCPNVISFSINNKLPLLKTYKKL